MKKKTLVFALFVLLFTINVSVFAEDVDNPKNLAISQEIKHSKNMVIAVDVENSRR